MLLGSRLNTTGFLGNRAATRSTLRRSIEQTSQRFCVRITSGFSAARSSSSSWYRLFPPAIAAETSASIALESPAWMRVRVSSGIDEIPAGKSHSWLRPTRRSAAPTAQSNSVAEGRRLTTRMGRSVAIAAQIAQSAQIHPASSAQFAYAMRVEFPPRANRNNCLNPSIAAAFSWCYARQRPQGAEARGRGTGQPKK